MPGDVYIALIHYPVLNRLGEVVATSIANMDIHDISRAARTYGARAFYIVTPLEEQRNLIMKIVKHWDEGYGATFNPLRKEAFKLIRIRCDLLEARQEMESECRGKLHVVATGAGISRPDLGWDELRRQIENGSGSYLILFGTGWGLAPQLIETADFRIEPLRGPGDYNHLAVRSAVAISLDRIKSDK